MGFRIYVAGSWTERAIIRKIMQKFVSLGYDITHDWTTDEDENVVDKDHERCRRCAEKDLGGVRMADAVVVVSEGSADDLVETTGIPREMVRVIFPPLTPGVAELSKEPIDHSWFRPDEPPVIRAPDNERPLGRNESVDPIHSVVQ